MIIPSERLSAETLSNLLEEFITREGTDYGAVELSLEAKLAALQQQLANGSVFIWFDTASETPQLLTKEQYRMLSLDGDDPEINPCQ